MYVPPNSQAPYYDSTFSAIDHIYHDSANDGTMNLNLLGDFNFGDKRKISGVTTVVWHNNYLIFGYQYISLPTQSKGNILDLLITNMQDSID